MKFRVKTDDFQSLRYFFAGIILLGISFAFQNYFYREKNQKEVNIRFAKILKEKERLLQDFFSVINSSKINLQDSSTFFCDEVKESKLNENGLAAFRYEKNTLVFWSTNMIGLPSEKLILNGSSKTIEKLKNGWYEVLQERDTSGINVGLILIKTEYPFENDYLKNEFRKEFDIPQGTRIIINNPDSASREKRDPPEIILQVPEKIMLDEKENFLLLFFYSSGFLLLIVVLYHLYQKLQFFQIRKWLLIICFSFDVILLRVLFFYFRIPHQIYESTLFGPTCFSSSFFLPSLGDFFINAIIFLILSYLFFRNFTLPNGFEKKGQLFKIALLGGLLILLIAGLFICIAIIHELVSNSTIPLTLQNITVFNRYSVIAFLIISIAVLSYLLIASRIFILLAIYIPGGFFRKEMAGSKNIPVKISVIFMVMMAIVATVSLNIFNKEMEMEKRQLLAVKLSAERDPMAEMLFAGLEGELAKDSLFIHFVKQDSIRQKKVGEDSVARYLTQKYFRESWNNYNVQITICSPLKFLRVQPRNYLVNCGTYFNELIQDFGKPTTSRRLFYLDYGYGFRNYLAVISPGPTPIGNAGPRAAYIEISSKLMFHDLGYPELLVDKKNSQIPETDEYSYAYYRFGKLLHRVGALQFSLDLDHALNHNTREAHFYTKSGLDNYCYPIDRNNVLIISKKSASLLDEIAPFSYLFFLFVLLTLIFFMIVRWPLMISFSRLQFSDRLQLSMIGILITSLCVVGFLVVYYIVTLNRDKNLTNLSDRTHSILVELQHKAGDGEDLNDEKPEEMNELLTKFSNIFFCDINLYNPDGKLVATSRPQIFEEGLIYPVMNHFAYANLRLAHSSLLILNETIGTHLYSSAYIPFFNDRNKLLAYLNVPYFAQQKELKKEVSTFLMAFINVYLFLLIVGFFLALLVSNYITRPLRLLTHGLGKLTLGESNEKLIWHKNDEVGKLVEEYNRKIDELARSAERLSQSERESAWREMARQIAHEIKNPLTPMKLSVQYLYKSWKENTQDWDQRIERFSATMIEQIDSLAYIASEFSDFAKMPESHNERIELGEIISNVKALYQDTITIEVEILTDEEHVFIIADRKQIMRVLTNLINNSIQAMDERIKGKIEIRLTESDKYYHIMLKDNGRGIPFDQTGKIFQPNFTTKSGGMGLGLAIVKSIIASAGGNITFVSEPGEGTAFTIQLPASRKL